MRQPPLEPSPVPGGDEAGAVRPDQAGLLTSDRALHADHVLDRNALGDAHGEIEAGVDALEDGVTREGWRHEDHGNGGARGRGGLMDGIEDRNLVTGVLEKLAALAGGDARDDLRAVVEGQLGVFAAEGAGDSLDEDLGGRSDENAHFKK